MLGGCDMARAYGCDLRAVLAGAVICWAVADGVAVAQEGAEATEELGNSYLLARRTTGQGSVIETLLFDGQAIVTEIAVPAPDAGATAGTTGLSPKSVHRSAPESWRVEIRLRSSPATIALSCA